MGLRPPFLDHVHGARVARTTGRTIHGGKPVNASTLPEPQRINPAPLDEALDSLKRARLELGTTRAQMAAEEIESARPYLIEALKLLDTTEDRDRHVRLLAIVAGLDDFREGLS